MKRGGGLGANPLPGGQCRFKVWAPYIDRVEVHIVSPRESFVPMTKDARGYHEAVLDGVDHETHYFYRLNGAHDHPDPASRAQPQGVHSPSQVTDSDFHWNDGDWCGLPLSKYVLYELHVGIYTREGTFEAIIGHLDRLKDFGITAIELMPVARFPGTRNWGYDGVYPFAVQDSYGGSEGLKRFIDACHQRDMAAVLDVVYNHLGPEGNYLAKFAPYFTNRYRTPWGDAVNFDGPDSDGVRDYFIQNALYWIDEFHFDALRLDAVHAIKDFSAKPFLRELAEKVHRLADDLNRRIHLIAESNSNDARLVRPPELGGFGLDAQWNDDFHHSVHALLTKENAGYYADFGRIEHLAKSLREGFVYSGQYSAFRRRRHGNSSKDVPAGRFVISIQNHDQVGNRMRGERLASLVSFRELKLAAGLMLLTPYIPLLFMGEEYGETAPFPYFIGFTDPDLVEAVRKGRREEFAAFAWGDEPPDPFDEGTFKSAKLNHALREKGRHRILYRFYKELLGMRRKMAPLAWPDKQRLDISVLEPRDILFMRRWADEEEVLAVFNLGTGEFGFEIPGSWRNGRIVFDSEAEDWSGAKKYVSSGRTLRDCSELPLPGGSFIMLHRAERELNEK